MIFAVTSGTGYTMELLCRNAEKIAYSATNEIVQECKPDLQAWAALP